MTIEHLVWDDWNRDHIAKHNVTPAEVEQVIDNEYVLFPSYSGRMVVIGQTDTKRALHITLANRGTERYYVVTARVADRKERAYYQQLRAEEEVQV